MKKYEPNEVEHVHVTLSKRLTPKVYEAKVQDYINGGVDEETARKTVDGEVLDMEIYYEDGHGMFLVESEAVECVPIYSPYTKSRLEECDDEDACITETSYVFEFDTCEYEREEVEAMSLQKCLELSKKDEDNVTKHECGDIQNLLNDDLIDTENCWIRVFV